jgi:phosphoglycerol transferase MdoB-like AlkP superfamily enzyme
MNQPTTGKIIKSEKTLELLESIGVVMRIMAFAMLSIMGKDTPFLWMWLWNTSDAIILTYCAWERNNKPYILMNTFWLIVGVVGIYTSVFGNPFSN